MDNIPWRQVSFKFLSHQSPGRTPGDSSSFSRSGVGILRPPLYQILGNAEADGWAHALRATGLVHPVHLKRPHVHPAILRGTQARAGSQGSRLPRAPPVTVTEPWHEHFSIGTSGVFFILISHPTWEFLWLQWPQLSCSCQV